MKYFVVADVHSYYNEMVKALNDAGYDKTNPNHMFVSLGDLLDRGTQPEECLDFVLSIPKTNRILIYGNHEDLMESAIVKRAWSPHDYTNGTVYTAMYLTGEINEGSALTQMYFNDKYNKYIKECVLYHETTSHIFVHGWIPHKIVPARLPIGDRRYSHKMVDNWRDADITEWRKALWYNGMESWADGVFETNKTICCGHWHTEWGHTKLHKEKTKIFTPFVDYGIVALDACTAISGFVNCYVFDED